MTKAAIPGKPKAEPLPAETYAGFSTSTPSQPPEDPGAPDVMRSDALWDLQREAPRRRLSPLSAGAALAATFVLGGVVSFALLHSPQALPPAAPVQLPHQPAPAPAPAPPAAAIAHALPPAPLALTVTDPTPVAEPAPPSRPQPRAAPARRMPRSPATPTCGRLDCQEGGLNALEQELNKAYSDAIRSGAAVGPLSEQQEGWLIRQERVRREDPAMAADLYRARIAELQALSAKTSAAAPNPQ